MLLFGCAFDDARDPTHGGAGEFYAWVMESNAVSCLRVSIYNSNNLSFQWRRPKPDPPLMAVVVNLMIISCIRRLISKF